MAKIYTPAVRPVEYVGDFPYPLREIKYARHEPVIILEAGDVVYLPVLTAKTIIKRKRRLFKRVDMLDLGGARSELDMQEELEAAQRANEENFNAKVVLIQENTALKEKIASFERNGDTFAGENTDDIQPDQVRITPENIIDESIVSLEMIKEACKRHNIPIAKKKREVLVSLLLPHLSI